MAARLAALGFHLEPLPFGEVTNLWARRGDAAPLFCFAGHTDVVPPGPLTHWTSHPFEPTIRDGMLYGRGAADMKGSLAAMVTATEGFVRAHPDHRGSIAFLITSDEEGVATDGTVKVVEALRGPRRGRSTSAWWGSRPAANGSATPSRTAGAGSLNGFLTVIGKQGHVAYPHLANNPLHAFAPVLAAAVRRGMGPGQRALPAHQLPDRQPQRRHRGGERHPRAPQRPVQPPLLQRADGGDIRRRVAAMLDEGDFDYELTWRLSGHPFLTPAGELVEAARGAIAEVTGEQAELSTCGGTSDGRFIATLGAQVLELGLLNATIHQTNECVAVADLERLSAIYRRHPGATASWVRAEHARRPAHDRHHPEAGYRRRSAEILARTEEVFGSPVARRSERLWDWQWHADPRLPTPATGGSWPSGKAGSSVTSRPSRRDSISAGGQRWPGGPSTPWCTGA